MREVLAFLASRHGARRLIIDQGHGDNGRLRG